MLAHLLLMDQPEIKREGFRVKAKRFVMPSNATSLDPIKKREVTICNLFANHLLPMRDISRILDENLDQVVSILIKYGLVHERRNAPQAPIKMERRRHFRA